MDGLSGVLFSLSLTTVKIVSANETSTTWENAKTWCSGKGSAWYLPSVDELEEIYDNRITLNTTLEARGATQFDLMAAVWSSEEVNTNQAKGWSFSSGVAKDFLKTNPIKVRAVRVL